MSRSHSGFKKTIVILLLTSPILLSSGCGGSNSGISANNISTQIHGVVFDAPVQGGTVTAYRYDAGQKGNIISSAQTGSLGEFTLSIEGYWGPAYFELQGGRYLNEATGSWVILNSGEALSAIYNIDPDVQIDSLVITPYTTIAAGLARSKIAKDSPVSAAISESNFEISNLLGVDIIKTRPLELSSGPVSSYSDQALYGLLIEAISQTTYQINGTNGWTGTASEINSVRVTGLMSDDASDGILDGKQNGSPIQFGTYLLDSYNYRSRLCRAAAFFLSGSQNKSGLAWTNFSRSLVFIAGNATALFPPSDLPMPVDPSAPALSLASAAQSGQIVNISATAADEISGVATLVLMPPSSISIPPAQGTAGPVSSVSLPVNLSEWPDGLYVFTATTEDWAGNQVYATISIKNTYHACASSGSLLSALTGC